MKTTESSPTNYEYFICAARHMIKHGGINGGKLRQRDFALGLGCSPEHLSGILSSRQKRQASVGLQEKIAAYFDMSLVSFLSMGRTIHEGGVPAAGKPKSPEGSYHVRERRRFTDNNVVAQVSQTVKMLYECREENDRLNSILDSLTEALTIMDTNGIIVYQNRSSRELLGSGLVGQFYKDAISSSGTVMIDGQQPAVFRCFQSKAVESSRFWVGDKCLSGKASPLFDNRAMFAGALFSAHDITEQQKLLDKNRLLVSQFSIALEKLNRGVCIYDKDNKIAFYNNTFVKITGAGEKDLVNLKTFRNYLEQSGLLAHPDEVFEEANKVRENKIKTVIEITASDGSEYLYSMEPVITDQGLFEGFMTTATPTTGSKQSGSKQSF